MEITRVGGPGDRFYPGGAISPLSITADVTRLSDPGTLGQTAPRRRVERGLHPDPRKSMGWDAIGYAGSFQERPYSWDDFLSVGSPRAASMRGASSTPHPHPPFPALNRVLASGFGATSSLRAKGTTRTPRAPHYCIGAPGCVAANYERRRPLEQGAEEQGGSLPPRWAPRFRECGSQVGSSACH